MRHTTLRQLALPGALLIDWLLGEPPDALHPVAWLGQLIAALERRAPRDRPRAELAYGAGLKVREAPLLRHDVYTADECFLTGTAAEVIPVVKVDMRRIGDGRPGAVTRDLMERFKRLTRG